MSSAVSPVGAAAAPVAPGGRRRMGAGAAALAAGAVILLALFAAGLVLIPRYRALHPATPLQRSDADRVAIEDVYLDLTLVTPSFRRSRQLDRHLAGRSPDAVLPVLVGIHTHRGSIEHMHHLDGHFFLVGPEGRRYPALANPIVLSQHHNAYLVLFPARDGRGARFLEARAGTLAVEALDVGAERLRRFEWPLPLEGGAGRGTSLLSGLALAVALIGALIVVLSPCALELTVYYSAIIACTVTESERHAAEVGGPAAAAAGRRRLVRNLASFVAGFTLLYAASGATVGWIGEGVRRPLGGWDRPLQIAAGLAILFFALRVLGADRLFRGWWRRVSPGETPLVAGILRLPRRILAPLRGRALARSASGEPMRARDSFLVGIGLSTSCLGCMGGAILYPLLVYAGITSWATGLVTLGFYSLAIALPMALLAFGFFEIRLSLARRVGVNRWLRNASGAALVAIGLLVLTGNERIVTDVTFTLLGEASRWLG